MMRHAIVRVPGENYSEGQTEAALGKPDFALTLQQHERYCATLRNLGVSVTALAPNRCFPDSTFVEDTAVVTEKGSVIARPAKERTGEELDMDQVIFGMYPSHGLFGKIKAPGALEGGDVLRIRNHFYIGVSQRTNADGANQLSDILDAWGYETSVIPVTGVLHLKTGVTYIGENTIIGIEEFLQRPEFKEYSKIEVLHYEAYAANCLLVNGALIMPAGFPRARSKIGEARCQHIIELEMSEFRKQDGGLTCLSLLF